MTERMTTWRDRHDRCCAKNPVFYPLCSVCPAPIGARSATLPSIRMQATNEWSAVFLSIAIGNTMIVSATLAGRGAGGGGVVKAELRSQNVALALHSMPPSVVCFAEKIVNFAKGVLGSVHGEMDEEITTSVPIFPP